MRKEGGRRKEKERKIGGGRMDERERRKKGIRKG